MDGPAAADLAGTDCPTCAICATLNRYFGSYRLIRHFLRRWIRPGDKLRMLDLATGSGDIPRLVVDFARETGARGGNRRGGFSGVDDRDRATTEHRLSRDPLPLRGHPSFWRANAPTTSCSSRSRYITLAADEAVKLLRRCRNLSRGKVLVADLARGWFAKLGVDLLTTSVFREAMTRNDARVSVKRSFSFRNSTISRARPAGATTAIVAFVLPGRQFGWSIPSPPKPGKVHDIPLTGTSP